MWYLHQIIISDIHTEYGAHIVPGVRSIELIDHTIPVHYHVMNILEYKYRVLWFAIQSYPPPIQLKMNRNSSNLERTIENKTLSTEYVTVHKMMPLTATRHPAVLFLSGINVTTPSAPIIGGAHWLIVHLLIARRCCFLITIKTAFPSWMISVLPYYSQYLSKFESDISQLSCHLPPETKKAVLTNHSHVFTNIASPFPLTSIIHIQAFIVRCHSRTIKITIILPVASYSSS